MYHRKHQLERNKGYINHAQLRDLSSQLLRLNITDIGAFHTDNAWIGAQAPCQLPVSNINGKYLACALFQQAVCKAAGRSADIHDAQTTRINLKMAECLFDL